MILDREALIAKEVAERRRHLRVQVNLGGRLFVPGDGREGKCRITEMSPGDAQIISEIVPDVGTYIVLYVEGFGRFDAEVARPEWDRFAATLRCSTLKQDRVADLLHDVTGHGAENDLALRRHERVAAPGLAHFTRSTGETVDCEVIDLSLSGVSLKTATKPRIGETVMVGQMSGRVVRHHDTGIAVEFANAAADNAKRPLQRLTLRRASSGP
ncbi:MAG TPA: PilZ domain-containing protein [Rhizomicrobium sp.]